jgi:hypothetical protein
MEDIFNSYFYVGDYKIGKLCYQSYPCHHTIVNLSTNKSEFLNAIEIYKILEKDSLSHPHFNYCKELIRQREYPTKEEIEIKQMKEKEYEIQQKEKQIEYDIKNGINRASSRLDALKLKNNCKL